jgi:hypothetical protein
LTAASEARDIIWAAQEDPGEKICKGYLARHTLTKDGNNSMRKDQLPTKMCPVSCQKTFYLEKKWEKKTGRVKYCSKRCSGNAKK